MELSSPSFGIFLITLWLGWRLQQVIQYSKQFRRKRVSVIEYPSWLGRFVSRVRYLLKCPDILLKSYVSERPIALPTPGPYFIHISSKAHIEELSQAPEDTLSLHAFARNLLQTEYTMDGIEFDDNMAENGVIHSRALGVLLKGHMDDLQPSLLSFISAAVAQCLGTGLPQVHDWTEVNSFDFATRVVTRANVVVFFGPQSASDPAFVNTAMQYPNDLFITAELLRMLPESTRPFAARLLKRKFNSPDRLVRYLVPLVEERIAELAAGSGQHHLDLIQFFITSNRRKGMWSARKIVQVILGVWFASVHQPALTLVNILDDCSTQPEASKLVREEIFGMMNAYKVPVNVEQLPFLDSFLRESARLHPTDSITARRIAIKPFTFRDGTRLEKNDVVCIPLEAIMKDQRHFPHSDSFDMYRHINLESMTLRSRFSEPGPDFPLWGLGRHACPGRHYASRLLKLIVIHLLSEYDMEIAGKGDRQSRIFSWRTSILPNSACRMKIRKKASFP